MVGGVVDVCMVGANSNSNRGRCVQPEPSQLWYSPFYLETVNIQHTQYTRSVGSLWAPTFGPLHFAQIVRAVYSQIKWLTHNLWEQYIPKSKWLRALSLKLRLCSGFFQVQVSHSLIPLFKILSLLIIAIGISIVIIFYHCHLSLSFIIVIDHCYCYWSLLLLLWPISSGWMAMPLPGAFRQLLITPRTKLWQLQTINIIFHCYCYQCYCYHWYCYHCYSWLLRSSCDNNSNINFWRFSVSPLSKHLKGRLTQC